MVTFVQHTKDGVVPSRAQIFIETHKDRKKGKKLMKSQRKQLN